MSDRPTKLQTWILAARPKTLPAAAAPVLVGTAVAYYEKVLRLDIVIVVFIVAILIQVGTNFANDLFDFYKGADNENRLGPTRVTQAGLLSSKEITAGMLFVFGLAIILGLFIVFEAGWPILIIGISAILAGLAYTGGPIPYGYHGLGDLFVFIFFGFAAVCGTFYAQAKYISTLSLWAAIPMGCLSTAILVVNNLRDFDSDRHAGKRTLVVRFGKRFGRIEYVLLCLFSFCVPVILLSLNLAPGWILLSYTALIALSKPLKIVLYQSGKALNQALASTSMLELIFAITFSFGFILSTII